MVQHLVNSSLHQMSEREAYFSIVVTLCGVDRHIHFGVFTGRGVDRLSVR